MSWWFKIPSLSDRTSITLLENNMLSICSRWFCSRAACLAAAILTVGPAVAAGQVRVQSDIFVGGQEGPDGTPHYRIPSFIVAPDGTLLAFAEARRNNSDPGHAGFPIDMVVKRSTDGGRTWTDYTVLHRDPRFDYSDPRAFVDHETGHVHLIYVQWPDGAGQIQVPKGLGDNSSVLIHRVSTDNGLTWSDPINITEQVKDPNWNALNSGPGIGIQLKWQTDPSRNGRLVVPSHRRDGNAMNAVPIYSDDHGQTWHAGGLTAGAGGDESEIIELTNGDLMYDSRQTAGNVRKRWISKDGGQTWSPVIDGDIVITAVDTALVRYSAKREGDDRDRILFAGPLGNPAGTGNGRTNLGIWTSYDEGKTFINPVLIAPGHAAYTVLDVLPDKTIGVVYEATGNTIIRYINVGLDALESPEHHRELTHYDGFGNTVMRNRGGMGWSGAWTGTGTFREEDLPLEISRFRSEAGRVDLVRGQYIERRLATPIDLNENGVTYISMHVSQMFDTSPNDSAGEYLDVLLRDADGRTRAAFGIGSAEHFFVNELGGTYHSDFNVLSREDRVLLVFKIVSQDNSSTDNFDQVFLKAFFDGRDTVPDSDADIEWTVVGGTNMNSDALLESIRIEGGVNVTWSIDEIRIGTTFSSVASNIPEPGSLLLLGLGASALSRRPAR